LHRSISFRTFNVSAGSSFLVLTTAAFCRQRGCQLKPRLPTGLYAIDADRFGLFQEFLIYRESDVLFRQDGIIFLWLIQSHCQRFRASAGLRYDSDHTRSLLIFHEFLNSFRCFLRDFDHYVVLDHEIVSYDSLPERTCYTAHPPPNSGTPPLSDVSPRKPTVTLSPSTMTGTVRFPRE